MADAFIGEIRPMAIGFTPAGWLECSGQLAPIAQYNVLYAVIGTAYGGDGQTTFGLPDLRGRTPMGVGNAPGSVNSGPIGTQQGQEGVALNSYNQLPPHNHSLTMETIPPAAGTSNMTAAPQPNASWLSRPVQIKTETTAATIPNMTPNVQPNSILQPNTVGIDGQGQPHENRQPYSTVRFCICYDGLFPTFP